MESLNYLFMSLENTLDRKSSEFSYLWNTSPNSSDLQGLVSDK